VDCPIDAVIDSTEPLKYSTSDAPSGRGKNLIGSKYFDSEGKPIKRDETEKTEVEMKDPVWNSVRGGTTRAEMEGCTYTLDPETQEVIDQLKVNMTSGEKTNGYEYNCSYRRVAFSDEFSWGCFFLGITVEVIRRNARTDER
jgi:hypothetical protein